MQIKNKINNGKKPTRKPKRKPQSIHVENDEIKYSFVFLLVLTCYV